MTDTRGSNAKINTLKTDYDPSLFGSHVHTNSRSFDTVMGKVADEFRHLGLMPDFHNPRITEQDKQIARLTVQRNIESSDADFSKDLEDLTEAIRRGFKLEKPQGSSWHHFQDFLSIKQAQGGKMSSQLTDEQRRILMGSFQSFVVEHDWSRAFSGAKDFDTGDFRLPFDEVVFEFRVSGIRILMPVHCSNGGPIRGMMVTGINGRWYVSANTFRFENGVLTDMVSHLKGTIFERLARDFIGKLGTQIRAICIMLEAKVAEGAPVEPSETLNRRRVLKGQTPLKAYHVVSLARRHRVRAEKTEGDGSPRRCHFRRGHWRHYQSEHAGKEHWPKPDGYMGSRSWIEWQLIGDPDLGFVEKHYRL